MLLMRRSQGHRGPAVPLWHHPWWDHCLFDSSLPAPQESDADKDVDHMSRQHWSHSQHTQADSELTGSFQTKLDALDSRLRNLNTRFVHYSRAVPSYLSTAVTHVVKSQVIYCRLFSNNVIHISDDKGMEIKFINCSCKCPTWNIANICITNFVLFQILSQIFHGTYHYW